MNAVDPALRVAVESAESLDAALSLAWDYFDEERARSSAELEAAGGARSHVGQIYKGFRVAADHACVAFLRARNNQSRMPDSLIESLRMLQRQKSRAAMSIRQNARVSIRHSYVSSFNTCLESAEQVLTYLIQRYYPAVVI